MTVFDGTTEDFFDFFVRLSLTQVVCDFPRLGRGHADRCGAACRVDFYRFVADMLR